MSFIGNTNEEVIPFPILTKEVGLWSINNFGTLQNPWLGMVEEIGELAHCLLKREQGIRGFDDPIYFLDQLKDALGDIGIYAANYAYNEEMRNIEYPKPVADLTMNKHIANVLFWLSELRLLGERKEDYKEWLKNLLLDVSCIARLEGIEFQEVVTETWLIVKMRNWKENAHDGSKATYEKDVMVDEKEQGKEDSNNSTS